MKLLVDAWLERKDPVIRLLDGNGKQALMRLEQDEIERMVSSGDLCLEDLQDTTLTWEQMLGLDC